MTTRKIAVIGLGYVGLPMAVEFGRLFPVVAFDINEKRVSELKHGLDSTLEVTPDKLQASTLKFTSDTQDLREADFYIVAVPTPIDGANQPDLAPLVGVSKMLSSVIAKGDIVVFESTVYPGATEEVCLPLLEDGSGLKAGKDFFLGYSPERINPGDKVHTFRTIQKIIAGQNAEITEVMAEVYGSVVEAGVWRASSIKVAEAAKVIENAQRDLNIAFVNELSKIFNLIGIDTQEVLEAAGSKWNFIKMNPGLVGGHCIGVDPYYLTYKAQSLGYHPEVLLAGRRINDGMAKYVAEQAIKAMISEGVQIRGADVAVLGVTFKENCPDTRNSKIFDVIDELKDYGVNVDVHDPYADPEIVLSKHQIRLMSDESLFNKKYTMVIVAVGHESYRQGELPEHDILIDVKALYPKDRAAFRL